MRITANQVTFARLVLMPFVGVLLYLGPGWRAVALSIGVLVGLTDYVDGWLARRQGPTVLGGLMDPIADKVFIAVGFLPLVDLGVVPLWAGVALFLRELLVTALRTSFELRGRHLTTTYLAKIKTWVQMCVLFFFVLGTLDPPRALVLGFLLTGTAIAAGAVLVVATRRILWVGGLVFAVAFGAGLVAFLAAGLIGLFWLMTVGVVAITWASGLDYLWVGVREVSTSLRLDDAVRLAGAIALAALVVPAIDTPVPWWLPVAILCLELAHGGLDNLLAHHRAAAPWWSWGTRVALVAALAGAAALVPARATALLVGALTATAVLTAWWFFRARSLYLGAVPDRPAAP